MDKLVISKDLKIGKQEILLEDGTGVSNSNKCGSEVEPLTADDLWHKLPDGTWVNLIDFIIQRNISIESLTVVVTGSSVQLNWIGSQDVRIFLDNDINGVTPNGDRVHNFTDLASGLHSVRVQATTDLRGLSKEFEVVQVVETQGQNIIITFNEGA